MELLIVSFVAGVLTVLAPCTLPFLPILLGGIASEARNWRKPFIIVASLVISILVFTLLLKASTTLLGVPTMVWQFISGGIILLFGVSLLFPALWEQIGARLGATTGSWLARATRQKGVSGDVLVGAALGPVFSSCSPTYALILASVLPAAPITGVLYLLAYVAGLGATLLLIGLVGQRLVARLRPASNPRGWFKRGLGILFIIIGFSIMLGLDKKLQSFVLEQGWYDPISSFEHSIMP